jgi:hypothetical protein
MEEKTFAQWWKDNEEDVLANFPHYSDVEIIKRLCLDCWKTQNTNCEIKMAQLSEV